MNTNPEEFLGIPNKENSGDKGKVVATAQLSVAGSASSSAAPPSLVVPPLPLTGALDGAKSPPASLPPPQLAGPSLAKFAFGGIMGLGVLAAAVVLVVGFLLFTAHNNRLESERIERLRMAQIEAERSAELEKQRLAEIERQRLAEIERVRVAAQQERDRQQAIFLR